MRTTNKFVLFWNGIFSNFYRAAFTDPETGIKFSTSEQYFMYKKAQTFGDINTADRILKSADPAVCKRLGRQVSRFDPVEWDKVKIQHMRRACHLKFTQNPQLKVALLSLYDNGKRKFVEASPHDSVWGIGMGEDDPLATNPTAWKGQNLLGEVLTTLANELCSETVSNNVTVKCCRACKWLINVMCHPWNASFGNRARTELFGYACASPDANEPSTVTFFDSNVVDAGVCEVWEKKDDEQV